MEPAFSASIDQHYFVVELKPIAGLPPNQKSEKIREKEDLFEKSGKMWENQGSFKFYTVAF